MEKLSPRALESAIVITGSVGIGKTLISRLLSKRMKISHIDLGKIALRKGFTLRIDKRRDTFIVDIKKLRDFLIEKLKRAKLPIIIEGHYAPYVIPNEFVWKAFVLRLDPIKLNERLKQRKMKKKKRMENVQAEILDVCLFDAIKSYGNKVCEIDTTNKEPNDIVKELIGILKGKIEGKIRKVDWLAKLHKEGKLELFF